MNLFSSCSMKLSKYRLYQLTILSLLHCLLLSFLFLAWRLSKKLFSFSLDSWRQSSQCCGAASAMQHCTYNNSNRVMTGGYLHAVEPMLWCRTGVCVCVSVVWSGKMSDASKTRGHAVWHHNKQHEKSAATTISSLFNYCMTFFACVSGKWAFISSQSLRLNGQGLKLFSTEKQYRSWRRLLMHQID